MAVTARPTPAAARGYAGRVRRARWLLQGLFVAAVVGGGILTILALSATHATLLSYRTVVEESARSADAAQAARTALLESHSAVADFLTLEGAAATAALERADERWQTYQEPLRILWQNRRDATFGEFEVFDAADRATTRYRGGVDAMRALSAAGDGAGASEAFLEANRTLVRELVPALNGLESLQLERMDEGYLEARDRIEGWTTLLQVTGLLVLLLLLGTLAMTRFWLHYAMTWEIALSLLGTLVLIGASLLILTLAARSAENSVREAYDAVSAVQAIEALLTQTTAAESLAAFDPERGPAFLRDADQYLFLLEQRLCGELGCTATSFLDPNNTAEIDPQVVEAALLGQGKYGLPRPPLVATARIDGEARALEGLRSGLADFRTVHEAISRAILVEQRPVTTEERRLSRDAFERSVSAARAEQTLARRSFLETNRVATLSLAAGRLFSPLFLLLGILAAFGIRRRRSALYAS